MKGLGQDPLNQMSRRYLSGICVRFFNYLSRSNVNQGHARTKGLNRIFLPVCGKVLYIHQSSPRVVWDAPSGAHETWDRSCFRGEHTATGGRARERARVC